MTGPREVRWRWPRAGWENAPAVWPPIGARLRRLIQAQVLGFGLARRADPQVVLLVRPIQPDGGGELVVLVVFIVVLIVKVGVEHAVPAGWKRL